MLTADNLKLILKSYESWVARNTDVVSDFETTAKWVSYFIAGRISNSNVVSELIYALSNMLVLYNDRIIDRARGASDDEDIFTVAQPNICYRLKVILTTLEYSEVFIEISANRVFGKNGKWLIITLLHTFKAASRLFILQHSTTQIIRTPMIPSINRRALIKQQKANGGVLPKIKTRGTRKIPEHSITVQLKRSGRIIRKVEGAPPIHCRDFKLYADIANTNGPDIPKQLLQAEYLYIAKPLLHLASMGLFGRRGWRQFLIALSLDLTSIRIYHAHRYLMTKKQKLELSRRCINLLYYLMRTPFYDRFTKTRLDRMLDFIANNVPIVRLLAAPLRDYIPYWQSTYFYVWST